jgi:hypothetical protein
MIWRAYLALCRMIQPSTVQVFEATQRILASLSIPLEDYIVCVFGLMLDAISCTLMLPLKMFGGSVDSVLGPALSVAATNLGGTAFYLLIGSACAAAGLKLGWTATSAAGSFALSFHRNVLRVLHTEPLSGPIGRSCAPPHPADTDADAVSCRAAPLCVVCHDAQVGAALRPCFHAGYCVRCADDVLARHMPCPMCRAPAAGVQRIFLP